MTISSIRKIQLNIKKFREEKNITQEILGEFVNVTTDYISLIERGKRIPSLKVLIKIAEGLEISLSDLVKID